MLHQWLSYDGGMAFFAFDSDMTATSLERFNLLLSELYGLSVNNDIVSDEEAYQIAAGGKAVCNYGLCAKQRPAFRKSAE